MPRPPVPGSEFNEIEKVVRARPGVTLAEIADLLGGQLPQRTLQYRLKRLVDDRRIIRDGDRRWARYRTPEAVRPAARPDSADGAILTLSREAQDIRAYLRRHQSARKPIGYNRDFLDSYRPGETFYIPVDTRARLAEVGSRHSSAEQPAGTRARQF